MNHGLTASGLALLDRHPSALHVRAAVWLVADRPADDAAAERVEHDRAVDLPLAGRMLDDVDQPELVRAVADEHPVDEIISRRRARHAAALASAAAGGNRGALHQHRDRVVTNPNAAAEHELGVHAFAP